MAFTNIDAASELVTPKAHEKRLYIVDDETELLATLAESLRELGFSPQTFECPEDLLQTTSKNETGCVITDLRMPGLGGVDLLKALNDQDSCLSVILLTAFADVPTAVDAMKLGAVSVVEKPFDLAALSKEVNAAMQVSESAYSRREKLSEAKEKLACLSADEIAVLDLAIEGRPNREIATSLAISPRTVDRRRHSALNKLDAESVAEYAVLRTVVST